MVGGGDGNKVAISPFVDASGEKNIGQEIWCFP